MAVFSFKAVELDGTDEYVTMGNVPELDFANNEDFSISAWVKTTSGAIIAIVSKRQIGAPDEGYEFSVVSGFIRLLLEDNATGRMFITATTTLVNDGLWHHVVATWNGVAGNAASNATLYVDDTPQSVTVGDDTLAATISNTADFQISGVDGTLRAFDGTIDDVAVYDKELTSGEVTTIYNGGNPNDLTVNGPTGNLVGYWRMGDGDTYPTLTDNSTNSNDGTMTNTESTDIVNANGGDFSSTGFGLGDIGDFEGFLTPGVDSSQIGLGGGAGGGFTVYFKMRALQDPGPGYHVWVVTDTPDFAGTNAPGAIQGGTAIITDTWTIVA